MEDMQTLLKLHYLLIDKMGPEEIVAVLRAPKQLYFNNVCFFTLFVTYFVHNVSSFLCYGKKKELLDIRTTITHLGLD